MQVSRVRTKERTVTIDIYTAAHLCEPPIEWMLNREILCSQLDSRSVKVQTARQQVNAHQPTQQPDGFLIEAGQGAFTAIFQ